MIYNRIINLKIKGRENKMTEEIKFDAANWFDYDCYGRYLNIRPLLISLSELDGVKARDVYESSRNGVTAILDLKIETDAVIKIDNEDVDVNVSFDGSHTMYYQIETNLSSEDAAQAEQNLKTAIKSGRHVFKVPTVATPDGSPSSIIRQPVVRDRNGNLLIEMSEACKLFRAALEGEETELGDYLFIKDLVPTLKTERIEFFCKVPEELMISSNSSNRKFHAKDWLNYYNAKLDEDDLKDSFSEEDLSGATSIQFDGEIISADLESNVSDLISVMAVDDETDEEEEYEVEIFADFTYSVDYKIDDLEEYIEDFTRSLNDAIDKEESTFEIRVPFVAGKAYDLEVNVTEIYDDEVDESKVRQAAFEYISNSLDEPTFQMHHGDFILPPSDKEIKFVCTIPAE